MAGVARFEDLIAWQRARLLARMVYAATRLEPFARDRALAWQIQRAAVSIMANLAEGFERGRATEFHQFASTAKASCAEVRSHLYLAFDNGYLNEVEFNRLMYLALEVSRVVGGLRADLERQVRSKRPVVTGDSVLSTQYSVLSDATP